MAGGPVVPGGPAMPFSRARKVTEVTKQDFVMSGELPRTLYLSSGNADLSAPGYYRWNLTETLGLGADVQGGMGEPLLMAVTAISVNGWVGDAVTPTQYDPSLLRVRCVEIKSDEIENSSPSEGLVYMGPLMYDRDSLISTRNDPLHSVNSYTPVHFTTLNNITLALDWSPWNQLPAVWTPIVTSADGPTKAFWLSVRVV